MSLNTIKKFIKTLSEGDYTQLDYDYKKYDCEMSALMPIICSQESDKYDGIVDFWNKKQESDYFEMQHPLHNHITTRAVFSVHHIYSNYVFFIDETNEYIWCAIQTEYTFSWFFCDDTLYVINASWYGYDFSFMHNISCEQLIYKDIKFGFLFNSNISLWHYIFDSFALIYELNLRKPLKNLPYYFTPSHVQLTNEELVFFYIGWSVSGHTPTNIQRNAIFKRMCEKIYKDSLVHLSKNLQDNDDYDLVLWFGLTYHNKSMKTWINQVDAAVNIIKELQKTFKKIKIYFDGMKAAENGEFYAFHYMNENANQIINEISSQLKDVEIVSLNGYSVKDAVCICSQIDIAIAECGAGAFLPVFCRKPAVLYGNGCYLLHASVALLPDEKTTRLVDLKYTEFVGLKEGNYWDVRNYCIPWQHIYNLTAELLENLSQDKKIKILDLKLNRLEVPPVELIAKQYEIGQKLGLDIPLEVCEEDADRILCTFSTKELNLAKARIQNHLSYKLGQALIINSKSLWGYLRMPYVLSYIKDKHKQDQKVCRSKIREENPYLALMPLENYPEEALKEKECFTYKLGEAFIMADKAWYKGGYLKFYFKDMPRLKREFQKKKLTMD